MTIFKTKLKSFVSDITGETRTYKVNTALWLHLEEDYGIKQGNLTDLYQSENALTNAKIATSILKANGLEVTLQELTEHVDEVSIDKFVAKFTETLLEDVNDSESNKSEKDKEGKSK
ncbi:hypothetical protein [Staphylococcus epidermidis]|uniref:hypothetical protein n=1 Tax=Staphylococcus epidermidis TaxID=1282 RepID=UPI00024E1372|nr:hypothetical protein [Staphylococcus epidermidis]EHR86742.1 hypothetical protein SEVCU118_1619 [Staphylococcus epidermidis VCU118]